MSDPENLDEAAFRHKQLSVPSIVVEKALILYAVLTDHDTPKWARALVLVALVYLMSPFDAVFDSIPVLGYADDLSLIALTLERISQFVTPRTRERARSLMPRRLRKDKSEDTSTHTGTDNLDNPENQSNINKPNNNTENEEGNTNNGEKETKCKGDSKVPFIERFRVIP